MNKNIDQMQKTHSRALQSVTEQEQVKADRRILELEKHHQEQIQKLKEDKQAEIDKYQTKYFELLEQQTKLKRTKATTTK